MKTLFRLVVFVLLVGGWGLAASALHLVRTDASNSREYIIVPKNRIGIDDTYVDTRAWTIDDVPSHKSVVNRMIETEKYMAIAHVTGEKEPAEVQQRLADALLRAPMPKAEATTTPVVEKKVQKAPAAKHTSSKRKSSNNKRQQMASR
jgi:hypothetical protein